MTSKNEEATYKSYELEKKLKEQTNTIENLRHDCEAYLQKLNVVEFELNKRLEAEIYRNKEANDLKDKQTEELTKASSQKHEIDRVKIENLTSELKSLKSITHTESNELLDLRQQNLDLNKSLDQLKAGYEQLKNETYFLNQKTSHESAETLKQLNLKLVQRDQQIAVLEAKLANNSDNFSSFLSKKNTDSRNDYSLNYKQPTLMRELSSDPEAVKTSGNCQSLEPTEVDYLKSIIYSYMMGTDPIVIVLIKHNCLDKQN